MRRIVAFFIAAVMIALMIPVSASAYAEGYYTYTVMNGAATITDVSTSISGEVVIPDTLGGYPVTGIGEDAFADCSQITDIYIPDGVTSIGNGAFYNCISLKSIEIPEGVTSIGQSTFYYCNSLESVVIPEGVTSIESQAFCHCSNLTTLDIPESVTSIGGYAFSACYKLTDINIPTGIKSIANATFQNCSNLTTIKIPDGVTYIGKQAFENCRDLTSINIPDGVTSINDKVFNSCESLTSINIPDKVTSIGEWAFLGCSGLTAIDIPDKVTSIGEWAFSECSNLTSINVSEKNTSYKSEDGVLFTKDGTDLIKYPPSKSTTEYIIPDGVTNIGYASFSKCHNLKSIEIPDTVISISESAFLSCENLESASIGNGATTIELGAFADCKSLKHIYIPKSVTSIGYDVFVGCSSLTAINVSDENTSYKSVDDVLITKDGTRLIQYPIGKTDTEYTIPDGVKTIGDDSFTGCTNLSIIHIPSGVKTIESNAFSECTGLTKFYIPKGITNINSGVFDGCTSLSEIYIPSGVTTVSTYAFSNCTGLKDVYYGGSKDAWTSISFYDGNTCLTKAKRIHYNVTDPENHYTYVTVDPTCTEDGSSSYSCPCGYSKDKTVIPATGHLHTEVRGASDPTCTDIGYTGDTYCIDCGEILAEGKVLTVEHSIVHHYGQFPTCAESGWMAYQTCTLCDYTTFQEVPATGKHSGGIASCSAKSVCDFCESEYGEVDPDNHLNTELVGAMEATVTHDGYTGDIHCHDCGAVITGEVIPELPATGDANGDGKVNLADANLIMLYCAGWDVQIDVGNADVNDDEQITLDDAALLMKYIAKWDVVLR